MCVELDSKYKERLLEISDWLKPLRKSFDPDNLSELSNQIKQFKEDGCELSGSLVTVCRLVQAIIVPQEHIEGKCSVSMVLQCILAYSYIKMG